MGRFQPGRGEKALSVITPSWARLALSPMQMLRWGEPQHPGEFELLQTGKLRLADGKAVW